MTIPDHGGSRQRAVIGSLVMFHLVKEWLMFSNVMPSEPPLWPLVLATILASAMILGRQTRD